MEEVGSEGWKLEYTKLEVFALQYLCFVILEEELVVSTRKKVGRMA
jgi:hypothetical protein